MSSVNICNFYRIRVVILQNRSCRTPDTQNHLQTTSIVWTIKLKKQLKNKNVRCFYIYPVPYIRDQRVPFQYVTYSVSISYFSLHFKNGEILKSYIKY
jgi:hypothetical protein